MTLKIGIIFLYDQSIENYSNYINRFIVANDEFKFKEFNIDSKQCRRTTLAPRYGCAVSKLLLIPNQYNSTIPAPLGEDDDVRNELFHKSYYAFSTPKRVIGLGSFPLTGDPSEAIITLLYLQYLPSFLT